MGDLKIEGNPFFTKFYLLKKYKVDLPNNIQIFRYLRITP